MRVSGEATIGHVEKFLRRKMGLDPACQVQYMYVKGKVRLKDYL